MCCLFFLFSLPGSSKIHIPNRYSFNDIRTESKFARISLHHQTKKKSLTSKKIYDRQEIDSLFKFIGQLKDNKACLQGGLYNYFGQISLYNDSSRNEKLAEIHFVPDGNCAGFYLETEHTLRSYNMTAMGKAFIMEIYNSKKNMLR